MSAKTHIWLATASALALLAGPAVAQNTTTNDANVTIVKPDGTAEQAGEAIDNAASSAGQAVENAAEATGDAARDATAVTGQAVENAGESMQNAAQPTTDTTAQTTTTTTPVETEAETVEVETVEPAEVEEANTEGTPVQGQIFQQSPNEYLASTLMDANVENPAGENIGDVSDMIIGDEGRVTGVVVGVGGFLGIGQKSVAIELGRIEITQQPDDPDDLRFVLNATEEELEDAPEFRTWRDQQNEAAAARANDPAATGTVGGMNQSTTTSTPPATAAQ